MNEASERDYKERVIEAIQENTNMLERCARLIAAAIVASSNNDPSKDGMFASSWATDAWRDTR